MQRSKSRQEMLGISMIAFEDLVDHEVEQRPADGPLEKILIILRGS